jgi:hypothetical protein
MDSVTDLNFTAIFYRNNEEVLRKEFNYLVADFYSVIETYFLHPDQNFYTALEVVYKGNVMFRRDLPAAKGCLLFHSNPDSL